MTDGSPAASRRGSLKDDRWLARRFAARLA
jgi:hypothetical protein